MIRRATQSLLFPALCLIAVASVRGADRVESAPKDKEDQTEASCLLKITFDPQTLPLDAQSITYLFSSSGIAGTPEGSDASAPQIEFQPMNTSKASPGPLNSKFFRSGLPATAVPKTVLGDLNRSGSATGGSVGGGSVSGSEPLRVFSFAPDRANQNSGDQDQTILGRLTVRSGDAKKSHELMTAVTKRFQAALENAQKSDLDRLHYSLDVTDKQADEALMRFKMLQEKRQALLASSEFNDLSRDSLLEISRKLESERQETAVRLETRKARNEALRRKLVDGTATQSPADPAQPPADPLAHYQQRVHELEKNLETLNASLGSENPKVQEAKASLYQTRAVLQQRTAEIAQAASAKFLDSLSDQLGDNSVDLVESEARLKLLQQKCKEMRELLTKADDYEIQVGLELPLAKMSYENARQRQEELRRRVSSILPPSVIVLGE